MAKTRTSRAQTKSNDSAPPRELGVPEFAKVPDYPWIRPWADRVLVAAFLLMAILPLVAWLSGKTSIETLGENRRLASLPSLSQELFEKWPATIDTYFRDNFGFRDKLIHANNVLLRKWLGVPGEGLVIGKGGWAFYRDPKEKIFENHLGMAPMNGQQLAHWKSYLEDRQSSRAARNIKTLFVIAPDKQTIYPEMLPAYLSPKGRTRVDQLLAYLRDTHSTANVLDLRPVLLDAKRNGLVFFPQDTHWNGRGYFAAYLAISRRLREWFPDLPVQTLGTNFGIKTIQSGQGDWGEVGLPEENLKYPSDVLVPIDNRHATLMAPNLPTALPVEPWLAAVRTSNPDGRHRLLLFHDSFMSYGVENRENGPLTRDFAEALSISRRLPDQRLLELENSFQPDVVVDEWVERQIMGPPMVKISIGGLASPLEITNPAISKFNPYAGPGVSVDGVEDTTGFIVNWRAGIVAPPPENLPHYSVSFYVGYPEFGLAYVVKYVFDPSTSQGCVYLPGPSDPISKINRMRYGHGFEGNWLRATQEWQTFALPLIRARASN
jgi:alginate O-acetyltransferase complex protein AlgJ